LSLAAIFVHGTKWSNLIEQGVGGWLWRRSRLVAAHFALY
jgi:hypothetical protein